MSGFGRWSYLLCHFGLGFFGLILGWVVSDYFGGSFRPDIPLPHPAPIFYIKMRQFIMKKYLFLTSHTWKQCTCILLRAHTSLRSAAASKNPTHLKKDVDTYPNPLLLLSTTVGKL